MLSDSKIRFLLLWAAGCIATLLQFGALPDYIRGVGFEPLAIARSLAGGEGFSNPYSALKTGPTAHCAPAYPSLLALGIRLLGGEDRLAVPLLLLHILMQGLAVALLPVAAERLMNNARAGWAAAATWLVLPVVPLDVRFGGTFLAPSLLLCLVIPATRGWAVLAGLMAALSLHVNPVGLPLLVGWLCWKRPGWRWTAQWSLTVLLLCLPWTVRNYLVIGQISLIRDNLPLELYVSNNDVSGVQLLANPALRTYHPNGNKDEAGAVKQLGEAQYMRDLGRRAREWIMAHPGRFVELTARRAWDYWFPDEASRIWHGLLLSALTLLSLPEMARRLRHPVFFAVFAVTPLIYYVVQSDPRYRYPFLWATVLCAGVPLSRAAELLPLSRRKLQPPLAQTR